MTKFHINSKGVPAPCKAIKGNCPYGGQDGTENHFDTIEEAQTHINEIFENQHGILSGLKSVPYERRVDLYHATSSQILQKIINEGSMSTPKNTGLTSNGLGFDNSAEDDGIYLAETNDDVSIYLDGAVENGTFNTNLPNCGVVIELYADSDNLIADKDDYKGENVDTATWQDSLDDCGQVVHKGNIDVNQIKSVQFKAPFNIGNYYNSKKKSVSDMAKIRRKLINGKKFTLKEAIDTIESINQEMKEKYS